jgi:hypothetical protein
VAGAPTGRGLADGLGDGDGLALALGVVALTVGVVALTVGVVPLALGAVALAVLLAEVGGAVPPGENDVGVVEGAPEVHAETDRGTSTAKMRQPRAVPKKRRWP